MESGGSNHGKTHTRICIEPWPKPMAKDPGKAPETHQRNRNPQRTNGHFFSHQRMGGRTGEQAPHTKHTDAKTDIRRFLGCNHQAQTESKPCLETPRKTHTKSNEGGNRLPFKFETRTRSCKPTEAVPNAKSTLLIQRM